MNDAPLPSDDLQELRRQARLNQLRLKIARQNEALSALRRSGHRDSLESFYDSSNYFDPRDYLFETPRFGGAPPTTRNDRDEGRNYPIFRTEQELALIRGAARLLTASNPIAVGVLASLTNYVIAGGFHYTTSPRRPSAGQLAATANTVIDEFLTENDWSGDLDRELFQRSRVDGEYFLGLWHVGRGHVQARAIEPDQVTEPTNKSGIEEWLGCNGGFVSNWAFGVHTHENDAQAVHGFYVQWSNLDTDWDYFPGGNEPIIPPGGAGTWVEHAKLNVVRSVKRGLSDFFPIDGNLELARRVLRNMGEGSAVQAAIAWIQEVAPGTTQAQTHTGTLSRADGSYTTLSQQGASRTHLVQQYDPATILKVPSGQKYLPGPLGAQHAPNFITAAEALLRTVALRWNLPEHLVTGSAANNNFASSLVAETPFVKYAESQQQFYAQRDRKTLWRVLWFAWSAGRFGDVPWTTLRQSLEIRVTPPQIEVRDPEKETRVRQMLHAAGILSRKTWSAQESLNFEQEQKNLRQEAANVAVPGAATDDLRSNGDSMEKENEKENKTWDPDKHPRGGHPANTGEFSEATGSGTPVKKQAARVNGDKGAIRQISPKQGGASSAVVNKGTGSANHSGEIKAYNPSIWQRAWDYVSQAWTTDPTKSGSVTVNGKEYPAPPTLSPGQQVIGNVRHRLLQPVYSGVKGTVVGVVKAPGAIVHHILSPIAALKEDWEQIKAFDAAWEQMSEQERMDFAVEFAAGSATMTLAGKTAAAISAKIAPYLKKVPNGAPLNVQGRLEKIYSRLGGQAPSKTAEDALQRIARTVDEIEDLHSGVPKQTPPPAPNMPDGRMYPPLEDSITRHPDGSITARAKGHSIQIGKDGSIVISSRKTGQIEFEQPGGGN